MSRITRLAIPLLALLLLRTSALNAQLCAGLPSFAAGNTQLQAGVGLGNNAKSFGGGLAFGSQQGPYAGVMVGGTTYDRWDATSFIVGADVGYQIPIGVTRRGHLCPEASVGFGFGPNDIGRTSADLSTRGFTLGARLGHAVPSSTTLQIVPTGAVRLGWQETELSDSADSREKDDTYGLFEFGVGFVFNSTFGVRPSVSLPVGLDGADPSFGIVLAFQLGRRR